MELLHFGHAGRVWIVFPTSYGRFFEAEDRGIPESLREPIAAGRMQLLCVDGFNKQTWYNRRMKPPNRVKRHQLYETYLLNEVLPLAKHLGASEQVGLTGFSMGGYHALNLALRHPRRFSDCVTLGGATQIRRFLGKAFDAGAYYHNPPDFLPGLQDREYLDPIRRIRWTFAVGERDGLLAENRRMARLFAEKAIPHELDVWGEQAGHDWPYWSRMAAKHLSR